MSHPFTFDEEYVKVEPCDHKFKYEFDVNDINEVQVMMYIGRTCTECDEIVKMDMAQGIAMCQALVKPPSGTRKSHALPIYNFKESECKHVKLDIEAPAVEDAVTGERTTKCLDCGGIVNVELTRSGDLRLSYLYGVANKPVPMMTDVNFPSLPRTA